MRSVTQLEQEIQRAIRQRTGLSQRQTLRNAVLLDPLLSRPTVILTAITTGIILMVWIVWGINSATLAATGSVVLAGLAGEAVWVSMASQDHFRQQPSVRPTAAGRGDFLTGPNP